MTAEFTEAECKQSVGTLVQITQPTTPLYLRHLTKKPKNSQRVEIEHFHFLS